MTTEVKELKGSGRPSQFEERAKEAVLPRQGQLNINDLAEIFNVTSATVRRWVGEGKIPRADSSFGRRLLWNTSTIRKVLADNGSKRYKDKSEVPDDIGNL